MLFWYFIPTISFTVFCFRVFFLVDISHCGWCQSIHKFNFISLFNLFWITGELQITSPAKQLRLSTSSNINVFWGVWGVWIAMYLEGSHVVRHSLKNAKEKRSDWDCFCCCFSLIAFMTMRQSSQDIYG